MPWGAKDKIFGRIIARFALCFKEVRERHSPTFPHMHQHPCMLIIYRNCLSNEQRTQQYCDDIVTNRPILINIGTLKVKTNRSKIFTVLTIRTFKVIVLKSNSVFLTLARIVGEKCLLLFCTEAIIYSEIMQSMKNEQNN